MASATPGIVGMMGSLARLRIDQFVTRHVGPIELSIGAAECVCIEGASGSGKTLLLRAIADLDPHGARPTSTTSCSSLPAPAWRHSVALVLAESQWWSNGSAIISTRASMPAWLAQLGLPDSAMSWEVARCSTGERQRLALLRTLMQAPAAFLLDEPTGNLDQESTQRVEGCCRLSTAAAGGIALGQSRCRPDRTGGATPLHPR
jgi:putative ABC transport system ATP-binding protein